MKFDVNEVFVCYVNKAFTPLFSFVFPIWKETFLFIWNPYRFFFFLHTLTLLNEGKKCKCEVFFLWRIIPLVLIS